MKKIEKLFRKISRKDREKLLFILEKLIAGDSHNLDVKKVKDSDFHRLKFKRFRIIFHYENKEVIIDSIKLRNEKTYKRL